MALIQGSGAAQEFLAEASLEQFQFREAELHGRGGENHEGDEGSGGQL